MARRGIGLGLLAAGLACWIVVFGDSDGLDRLDTAVGVLGALCLFAATAVLTTARRRNG